MEPNTHCSDIKYFYLELMAFYLILIGLSGELFWNKGTANKGTANKGISKHVLHKEAAKASNMSYQPILNLRQQFYRHRLDDKTIERIKELGLKESSEVVEEVEIRLELGPQTREFTNTCSKHA